MNTEKVTIIAEAGVNHNGELAIAKQLIDVAEKAGADYVKFQAFKADKLVSREAKKAEYQKKNIGDDDDNQYNMLSQLEIDREFHEKLQTYCNEKNIGFYSSPFDLDGIEMLHQIGMRVFKVPSGEITNLPYLRKLGELNCEIILSSGMSDLDEIAKALNVLEESGTGKDKITVLHCNTDYPTRFEDVNLLAMNTIGMELGVRIGYSDHTPGIEVPVAATALGAKVIEKHFTLDRSMKGPDHKASLEPDELGHMVGAIRNIEMALGDGVKKPSKSEIKNIPIARKSIHVARNLKKGHQLKQDDLIMLRPGDGISPMEVDQFTGRVLNSDLPEGHKLRIEDLE